MGAAAAKRYARAIFELAREEGQVEEWAQRLSAVRDVLTQPDARRVLANPSIAVQRREETAAALVERLAGREGVNLARLLVAANRIDDLGGIIEEYQQLADEDAGRVRATATTAVPLERTDAGRLEASLTRRLGRQVRLDTRVEPAIIGGLVLRIGDRVIDASVATRLQQLRHRLAGV
ncbi:MAG TPA: F0F1 ATP synthase subunit delta [Candidatus Dormibacteraeota bacterium]|jgi:F-type H+-transporting ATPase subunit delta